jgi:hypothetical protein
MPIRRAGGASRLRLHDLTFDERFALISSWWHPGHTRPGLRFTTWAEYFAVYEQVRAELLPGRRWLPFAECALPIFKAGGDPLSAIAAHDEAYQRYLQTWSPHA